MKNQKSKIDYPFILNTINGNKAIKTILYVGAGIASLYLMGRLLSVFATTIRGINDFKSAINGK